MENAIKDKGDEIAMKSEQHVEEATTEDPIDEVKQVEDTEVACEEPVEETKTQPDCFQLLWIRK